MVRSRSGTGGKVIAVTFGAAMLSCTIVLSSAVVADRLAAQDGRPAATLVWQSHQIDRTNKTDPLTVRQDAPSAMPTGCESSFARPSPEPLTRTASRCVTELIVPRGSNKLAALR